jgi:hypothetical protein
MSIDAKLIESYTQGINSPAASQAGYFTVATSAEPMNLDYKSPSEFAEKLASQVVDHTASASGATVASGGGTHTLDFSTTTGKRYNLIVRAMSENGSGDVLFDEEREAIVTNPAGTAIIKSNVVAYTNSAASWTLGLSVVGSSIRATLTNSTGTTRGCRLSFELARVASIPTAP